MFAPNDSEPIVGPECVPLTLEQCQQKIQEMETKFETDPLFSDIKRFYEMLHSKFGIKRIFAVEAFHCYEAYGMILFSL